MSDDKIEGFRPKSEDRVQVKASSFREILEKVSAEEIDMLVAQIREIKDRMAEHAKTLETQASFRAEVQMAMRIIQWLSGAAVVFGMAAGGAMVSALLTLNEVKGHMADMPTPVQLQLMQQNITDMLNRINNLENRPASNQATQLNRHH